MEKLSTSGLALSFGGVAALDALDFSVSTGEIRGVIGPNGAGKTTLLNVISGMTRPTRGDIRLDGHSIARLRSSEIASRGVGRTFQTSKLFSGLTVIENVMAGMHAKLGSGVIASALGLPSVWRDEALAREKACEALHFVQMDRFADYDAGSLSFGQQRLIEIARTLVSEPTVILLDEPAVGLSPRRVEDLDLLLRRIRDDRGITIVMVEHVIRLVMGVCDRITVLNSGRKIAEGTADEVIGDPFVKEAYLGKVTHAELTES